MGVLFHFCGGSGVWFYCGYLGGRGCEGNIRLIVLASILIKVLITCFTGRVGFWYDGR